MAIIDENEEFNNDNNGIFQNFESNNTIEYENMPIEIVNSNLNNFNNGELKLFCFKCLYYFMIF